jgi:DNA-binding Lrp family transcriptional regulator
MNALAHGNMATGVGFPGEGTRRMSSGIDDIDRRILDELRRDGRQSVRQLAERVSVSRANAYARIERLTATGVITGYTALVDPVKTGLSTSAYVTLSVRQRSWRDLQEQLRAIPEVRHMALVGGEFDVILLVRAADNAALRHVVLDELQAIPGVLSSRTFLIFEDLENR